MADENEQKEELLAGKYKDPAALEQAYLELQAKYSSRHPDETPAEPQPQPEPAQPETQDAEAEDGSAFQIGQERPPTEDAAQAAAIGVEALQAKEDEIRQMLAEHGGELPEGALDDFPEEAKPFLDTWVKGLKSGIEDRVKVLSEICTADEFVELDNWAKKNLTPAELEEINKQTAPDAPIQLAAVALKGLKARWENTAPGRLEGSAAPPDVFKSDWQFNKAMADQRFFDDPHYRQEVIDKAGRSPALWGTE